MSKINNKNLIKFTLILLVILAISPFFIPKNAKADPYYSYIEYLNNEDCYFEGYNYCNYSANNNYNNWNNNGSNNWNNNGYNNYHNQLNPVPSVSAVTPRSVNINSNATITVSGQNFTPSSVIRLNGTEINTSFINSGTLKGQINSGHVYNKGDYAITVFTPAPGGGYSNAVTFTTTSVVSSSKNNTTSSSVTTKNTTTKKSTTTINDKSKEELDNMGSLAAGAIFGKNAFMPSSLLQWIFFFILILLGVILWRKLYISEREKSIPLKHA